MNDEIRYRPGSPEDSYGAFLVFDESIDELLVRLGLTHESGEAEPEDLARMWEQRRGLYEHLAIHNEHFWVAEAGGKIVGYARSILRDGVRQLTEFFVRPSVQAGGVGKTLLDRVFPLEGAEKRSIIATQDIPAQARYLKKGMFPQFPIFYFAKTPETRPDDFAGLEPGRAPITDEVLAILAGIDRQVLSFTRGADHRYLASNRDLYLYHRDGKAVGYGYIGRSSGPFALLAPGDYPAVLYHAESVLAGTGIDHFGLEVPMVNRQAVNHLLANGFRMDAFIAFVMMDQPFGRFDRYILSTPPFFL